MVALVLLHRPGLTGLPRAFPFGHGVIYSSVWVGSFDFCGFGLIRGFHCCLSVCVHVYETNFHANHRLHVESGL
jgi:hypothetical protein